MLYNGKDIDYLFMKVLLLHKDAVNVYKCIYF